MLNLEAAGVIWHFSLWLHHAWQRLPAYMSNIWLKTLKQLGPSEHLLDRVPVPTEALGEMELLKNKFQENPGETLPFPSTA